MQTNKIHPIKVFFLKANLRYCIQSDYRIFLRISVTEQRRMTWNKLKPSLIINEVISISTHLEFFEKCNLS